MIYDWKLLFWLPQTEKQTDEKKMIGVEFEMDFFFREYQIATGIFDGLVESNFD